MAKAKKHKAYTALVASALILSGAVIGRVTAPVTVETVYQTIKVTEVVEVPVPAEEPVEPEVDDIVYYDVPLAHELQDYIHTLCIEENVPMSLVMAMIERESSFQANVISRTNDYGLMQINACNHASLRKAYGITDFLDPYQNVYCGIKMIGGLIQKYGDLHKAVMAYQMGEGGASKQWAQGIYTSPYSRSLLSLMDEYEAEVTDEQ